MYLENINSPADVKAVGIDKLDILAGEVRKHLLQKLSDHGGHIGSNLGMVEATVALHYVFNSPIDKMVFDVSHQSYAHKMLTGRKDAFLNPAEYDEVSGYTEPSESEHDQFVVGHTSTSVSLACGLAKGRDLKGGKENVIAVIGDGSLSGGEALEGLDMAAELDTNIIIVVNDNQMSIAENHGGLYKNLQLLRETNGGAQCNLFKAMGLDYVYVGEGNNVKALVEAFQKVKDTTRPVVVHINTVKGKGYKFAEEQKERFHWGFPFVIETGETKKEYQFGPDFGVHTAQMLLDEMQKDPAVVALTAGTPGIWGWNAEMRQKAGKQFVDVGIAEEHAVTMAAGLAAGGARPFVAIYDSFLQRAYDQILLDVCEQHLPVCFLVDRAGLIEDGVTHQGVYGNAFLTQMPGLTVLNAATCDELQAMIRYALTLDAPVAIRYGKTETENVAVWPREKPYAPMWPLLRTGDALAILACGAMVGQAMRAAELLDQQSLHCAVYAADCIQPLDESVLNQLKDSKLVTLEEGVVSGGLSSLVPAWRAAHGVCKPLLTLGVEGLCATQGDHTLQLRAQGLDAESVARRIAQWSKESKA